MPTHFGRLLLAAACLSLAACARSLPRYEQPLSRTASQHVRTTAYTHSESDHQPYGHQTAAGTTLQYGRIHSAAADWSRWPNGTVFRIRETGEVCQVDDYGWALAGTNTIDLYKPSREGMNAWGVKRVNIDILAWGDAWKSYGILQPRRKYAHVRRMLKQIDDRYSRTSVAAMPTVSDQAGLLATSGPVEPPAAPPPPPPPEAAPSPRLPAPPAVVRVATRAPAGSNATSVPSSSAPPTGRGPGLTPFYR